MTWKLEMSEAKDWARFTWENSEFILSWRAMYIFHVLTLCDSIYSLCEHLVWIINFLDKKKLLGHIVRAKHDTIILFTFWGTYKCNLTLIKVKSDVLQTWKAEFYDAHHKKTDLPIFRKSNSGVIHFEASQNVQRLPHPVEASQNVHRLLHPVEVSQNVHRLLHTVSLQLKGIGKLFND